MRIYRNFVCINDNQTSRNLPVSIGICDTAKTHRSSIHNTAVCINFYNTFGNRAVVQVRNACRTPLIVRSTNASQCQRNRNVFNRTAVRTTNTCPHNNRRVGIGNLKTDIFNDCILCQTRENTSFKTLCVAPLYVCKITDSITVAVQISCKRNGMRVNIIII